jgi:hypothetical protein
MRRKSERGSIVVSSSTEIIKAPANRHLAAVVAHPVEYLLPVLATRGFASARRVAAAPAAMKLCVARSRK